MVGRVHNNRAGILVGITMVGHQPTAMMSR